MNEAQDQFQEEAVHIKSTVHLQDRCTICEQIDISTSLDMQGRGATFGKVIFLLN